jgi:hypothetical protein
MVKMISSLLVTKSMDTELDFETILLPAANDIMQLLGRNIFKPDGLMHYYVFSTNLNHIKKKDICFLFEKGTQSNAPENKMANSIFAQIFDSSHECPKVFGPLVVYYRHPVKHTPYIDMEVGEDFWKVFRNMTRIVKEEGSFSHSVGMGHELGSS